MLPVRTRFGIALVAGLVLAAGAVSAQDLDTPPATEVPLELLFSRPLVRGALDTGDPIGLLVDPQLPVTRVAPGLAERLELGKDDTPIAISVTLGEATLTQLPVEVHDTGGLLPEIRSTVQLPGVLSLSAWPGQLVTFDYRRWLLRIESGELPAANGEDVFALDPDTGDLLVDVTVGGRTITCKVDPWFPGGLLLPSSWLDSLPMLGDPTAPRPIATRSRMLSTREVQLAGTVTMAGIAHDTPRVLFGDVGTIGIVGHQWLSRLALTYDLAHGRARIVPVELEDPDAEPDESVAALRVQP